MDDRKNKISSLVEQLMGKKKTWAIVLIIGLLLAVIVYFAAYLQVSRPGEDELYMIPGGAYLVRIARKVHLV